MLDTNKTHVKVWGVVYESDVVPKVVSNFYHEFSVSNNDHVRVNFYLLEAGPLILNNFQHSIPLYHSLAEEYSSSLVDSAGQVAIQFSPKNNNLAVILYKCRIALIFLLLYWFALAGIRNV